MLQPSRPSIQRLMFMRDVVIPYVKDRAREGKVDLNNMQHPCGTPACLAGWTIEVFYRELGIRNQSSCASIIQMNEALGIKGRESYRIFHGIKGFPEKNSNLEETLNSLDNRAEACTKNIEQQLAAVECSTG